LTPFETPISTLSSGAITPTIGGAILPAGDTNRLTTENKNFLEYVKLVRQFYQTGEARPVDWDVPELDD